MKRMKARKCLCIQVFSLSLALYSILRLYKMAKDYNFVCFNHEAEELISKQ